VIEEPAAIHMEKPNLVRWERYCAPDFVYGVDGR